MEYDQYITYSGDVYNFDNQVDSFLVSAAGYGLPPVRHITQETVYSHGASYLGYRIEPRVVRIIHRNISATTRAEFWNLRSLLMDYVKYNQNGPGKLRKVLPDGSIRDLDVYVNSGFTFDMDKPLAYCGWHLQDMIEFIAYDPFFYNPNEFSEIFSQASNTNLIFPITFPITFGNSLLTPTKNITYGGSWASLPKIIITGPIDTPTIINNTSNRLIKLNYSVSSGEVVTIDLSHGVKTVVNNYGVNLLGTVTFDSDLINFKLETTPQAVNGVNSITTNGGGIGHTTSIELQYKERFIGI